jgi:Cyclin
MEQTSPSGRHKNIHNPIWRQMIVDWCYQIIDHIGADRELVYITMNILDRFLAAVHFLAKNKKQDATTPTLLPRSTASSVRTRNYLTDKKAYETAVMTSLLITMKLQGLSSLCITDLVQMSSNSVTSKDIIEVGKEIISILSWNRKIPTAARFVHEMVHLLPDSVDERTKVSLYEMSVFQVELSIQDESCSHHPPSLVAWMSLENAMDDMSVPKYIRAIVRRTISKELGHEYNYFLRTMLYKFQNYNHFLCGTSSPAIIPPDDDEEEEENDRIIGAKNNYLTCSPSDDLLLLNLKSRPTFQHANGIVISMEDLSDISSSFMPPSQQRSQQDIVPNVIARNDCSSPRKTSKRIRVS